MPLVFVLEYGVLRLSGAAPLGAPFPIATILAFFVMFFVGAVGEELGWQGSPHLYVSLIFRARMGSTNQHSSIHKSSVAACP